MKTSLLTLTVIAAGLLLAAPALHAQINYQGRLTNGSGLAIPPGPTTVTVSLWSSASGSTGKLWGDYVFDGGAGDGHAPKVDVVADGRFNVIIGSADTFNPSRSLTAALGTAGTATSYLEIKVGTNPAISPRQAVLAAPRALTIPNVTPNGANTGIGTSSAAKTLDVNGDIRGSFILRQDGSYEKGSIFSNSGFGMIFRAAQDAPSNANFLFSDAADNHLMVINPTGNVGIGTDGPVAKLEVVGPTDAPALQIRGAGSSAQTWQFYPTSSNTLALFTPGLRLAAFGTNGDAFFGGMGDNAGSGAILTVKRGANVGIGTTNPTKGKLEVLGSAATTVNIGGFLNRNGAGDLSNTNRASTISIYASNEIAGTEMLAFSDERIKDIMGLSDSAADLRTIQQIEITDYYFKDKTGKGSAPRKKVIAQQVASVYPLSVSTITDVVPDIYEKATVSEGWVQLATDLKKGERVRLTDDKTTAIYEVLEIREGAFRTAFAPEGAEVFVYGREVNDFHLVDYEAIAMLNVSATQELARKLAVKDAEVAALQAQNAALAEQLAALGKAVRVLSSKQPAGESRLVSAEPR